MTEFLVEFYLSRTESPESARRAAALAAIAFERVSEVIGDTRPGSGPDGGNTDGGNTDGGHPDGGQS
jgi:hypothetical protein